ncbi:MAG: ImmA/IrrE family metallo-endopeptidase [Oscillospiraceae bacterium]|nr:ImmA/IrrE family metallo-endopeptidase [Oscillospiraceae bacterium]
MEKRTVNKKTNRKTQSCDKIINFNRTTRENSPQLFIEKGGILKTLNSLGVTVYFTQPNSVHLKMDGEQKYAILTRRHDTGFYSIYISNKLSFKKTQTALCHELGHIVLGHLSNEKYYKMTTEQREDEADKFTSFMMPYIFEPKYRYRGENV